MVNAADIAGLSDLGAEERHLLASACAKNLWLACGIAFQHRSATPEKHFSFLNSDTLESLLEYFRSGPHGIREGVVYRDLAFVQQVDFGDEWLVLKREFDPETGEAFWLPFESYSFDRITESKARFECAICALREADPYDIAALLAHGAKTPNRQRQERTLF